MAPHPAELKVVGKRLPRVDARERVTGEAVYPADLELPGMVHAKLLRSPHAHARIRGIDTSRAQALKGVLAVVTAADFPELPRGRDDPHGRARLRHVDGRAAQSGAPQGALGRAAGGGRRRRSTCTSRRQRWR
jgi:CO/xanthine dehydrogenase Mo-binding subunit